MRGSLLMIFVVLVLGLFAIAQSSVAQSFMSGDRVEVFGGFSYVRPDFTGIGSGGPGWNVAGSVRVIRFLRVVGDFSGFFPSGPGGANAHYNMFMGGPEVAVRIRTYRPFAHFLLGDTKGSLTYAGAQNGGNFDHFTSGAGGGVDLGVNRWIAVRVEGDWLHVSGQFLSSNDVARFSTGLVVRF